MKVELSLINISIKQFIEIYNKINNTDVFFYTLKKENNHYIIGFDKQNIDIISKEFELLITTYKDIINIIDFNTFKFYDFDKYTNFLNLLVSNKRIDILNEYNTVLTDEYKKISIKFKSYDVLLNRISERILIYEKALNNFDANLTNLEYSMLENNVYDIRSNFITLKNYLDDINSEFSKDIQIDSKVTFN